MANNNHNNSGNNHKKENSHHHYNRFRGGRSRRKENYENKEDYEEVENKESNHERKEHRNYKEHREEREVKEVREHRNNRDNRDNQVIHTFMLGEKELEGKNAQFHYDKGWYSIVDVLGEEKNVIYKSKNAQEAYTKWNVYIGRKKERASKTEKAE